MTKYGIVGIPDSEIHTEIQKKYGSNQENLTYAEQIAIIAGEFTSRTPVSATRNGGVKARREYRKQLRDYVKEQSKERVKPVGFVGGFLFFAILSGIISWVVQRILTNYFKEEEKE